MTTELQTEVAAAMRTGAEKGAATARAEGLSGSAVLMAATADRGDAAVSILLREIVRLQARVAVLEAAPLVYDGPYETGKTYKKGTFVTHAGSLWHANYTTAARPGDGPAWTLAVKRGADGKDLR